MEEQIVSISTRFIKLEALLKFAALTQTGGEAKTRIQSGEVTVNGRVCTQRGKKLYAGDVAQFGGVRLTVQCM